MDARPPQDNPDRLVDDTYLQAVVGGMVDTDGTYPIYPNNQQTPLGGLSPQSIIVDPIPADTPQRDLVADLVTLRTGPVFAGNAQHPAAPSAPSSSPTGGVTPPNPTPPPISPFTPPPTPSLTPLAMLANGMNADNIGINVRNYQNAVYAPSDMTLLKSQGVTYFRIPMDISFIMPGLPLTGGAPGELSTTATCAAVLAHIDAVMSLMASFGFVMVPVLFVDKGLRIARGNAGTFNTMMTGAMTFMAGRWLNPTSPTYYSPDKLILNIYNEPRYGPTQGFAYTLWSDPLDNTAGLMPLMINAVRAVSTAHILLVDTVGLGHPDNLAFQGISPDPNIVYSCHIYYPSGLTQIGQPGSPADPQYQYPGRGEVIGLPPPPQFVINWKTGTMLTGKHQKEKWLPDQLGNVSTRKEDYWNTEITGAQLRSYVQLVRTWATAHSVRVIIGEFGTTNIAPYTSRLQWVQDMVDICHDLSLPYSWWAIIGNQYGIRPKGDISASNAVIDTDPNSPTFRYDTDLLRILKYTP